MIWKLIYTRIINHTHNFEPELRKKYLTHTWFLNQKCTSNISHTHNFETQMHKKSLRSHMLVHQKCTRNLSRTHAFQPELQNQHRTQTWFWTRNAKQIFTTHMLSNQNYRSKIEHKHYFVLELNIHEIILPHTLFWI